LPTVVGMDRTRHAAGHARAITSFIRVHLTYANVVATMALLFAMGGSALAADQFVASPAKTGSKEFTAPPKSKEFGYLITSISQISPRVQAELNATEKAGSAGPTGEPGTPGSQGTPGLSGAPGAQGTPGLSGAPGAQGIEGVQGKEGTEGKPGEQGARGEKGETGSQGEPGLSLLSRTEQETLKSILPYVKFEDKGVNEKPTIQISGANVQIINGEVSTEP
jgi:Collagen triple helix repeat (20 copies)